jgi:pimeloyl-ACP methyl ester carboxylesterase
MQELLERAAPHADAIVATADGCRRSTQFITVRYEHIPPELLAHQIRGAANCHAAGPLIEHAIREGWDLDAERITCPVRVVWGMDDKPLPAARCSAGDIATDSRLHRALSGDGRPYAARKTCTPVRA